MNQITREPNGTLGQWVSGGGKSSVGLLEYKGVARGQVVLVTQPPPHPPTALSRDIMRTTEDSPAGGSLHAQAGEGMLRVT